MYRIEFVGSGKPYRLDADKWLRLVGEKTRNNILADMRKQPKGGRRYRRGRRFHVASAPGEAPAIDTGFLARSITSEVALNTLIVTAGVSYASYLEDGTRKMGARPFMLKNLRLALQQVPLQGVVTR